MVSRPSHAFFSSLILAFVCLCSAPVCAWDGVVLRVVDGDTLIVAPQNARQPEQAALAVRLYGIDAPELRHLGGQQAKAALEALAPPGSNVEIVPIEADRYDRTVGLVLAGGVLVNLEQIRSGHAWVYERYCRARFCVQWKREEAVHPTP